MFIVKGPSVMKMKFTCEALHIMKFHGGRVCDHIAIKLSAQAIDGVKHKVGMVFGCAL